MEKNYVYIVFSSTPYKMGKFIRRITGQPFNHVSIALDEKMEASFSFARHYEDTPLYGGFVRETRQRFYYKRSSSHISICAIPLSQKELQKVEYYLKSIEENQAQYLYNTFSAIFTPMKRRIYIEKSYTCSEFVVSVLALVKEEFDEEKFYSIMELWDKLKQYKIYEGTIDKLGAPVKTYEDDFSSKHSFFSVAYYTLSMLNKLTWRLCRARNMK